MRGSIIIRYEVVLANKEMDQQGQSMTQGFKECVAIAIYGENNALRWMMLPNAQGRRPEKLPWWGYCWREKNGDMMLITNDGRPVATLGLFSLLAAKGKRGGIKLPEYGSGYQVSYPGTHVNRVGTGIWTVLYNGRVGAVGGYIETEWKFKTSGGGGGGAAIVASGGSIVLTDPQGNDWKYTYGGLGAGAGWKEMPKYGGAGGTYQLPNKGIVFKNPLRLHRSELKKEDFEGLCVWLEGAAADALGVSAAAFGLNCRMFNLIPFASIPVPLAYVDCVGVTSGLAAGGDMCMGYLKGAW